MSDPRKRRALVLSSGVRIIVRGLEEHELPAIREAFARFRAGQGRIQDPLAAILHRAIILPRFRSEEAPAETPAPTELHLLDLSNEDVEVIAGTIGALSHPDLVAAMAGAMPSAAAVH